MPGLSVILKFATARASATLSPAGEAVEPDEADGASKRPRMVTEQWARPFRARPSASTSAAAHPGVRQTQPRWSRL